MKYLLNWNDEYLDMQIVSGPWADDAAAQQTMKETTIERLVQIGVADDAKGAEEMYLTAKKNGYGRPVCQSLRGIHYIW